MKIEDAVKYAAEDADVTLRLWQLFKPRLHREKVTTVYETLERPLVPVLAQMEMHGVQVDRDTLSRMSNAFAQKMAGLEAEIHELAGQSFNVGSPKQLGEILFDKLGLEGGKKGKTGAYATGADVLEDLAAQHDLPARVLDWRQLSKLKSTYTDALQTHIDPDTGRVHTSYLQTGASTGRLASTDPNLQNIPIRTEEGRRIREAFVAPEGKVLVSLDYSQIELRILAHVAGIESMKQAFRDGEDIHAATASEMFDVPLDEMTPDVRRQAKAINFGVIYGISGFGLARNLRIPRGEAQGFIDRYFEKYPGIKEYMDDTVAFAKEHGHVATLFGRKIHTPRSTQKGPTPGSPAAPRSTRRSRVGGGHHPPRHDPNAGRDLRPAGEDAATGARRTDLRGRRGRRGQGRDGHPRRDGRRGRSGREARHPSGGRCRAGRELGRGALSRLRVHPRIHRHRVSEGDRAAEFRAFEQIADLGPAPLAPDEARSLHHPDMVDEHGVAQPRCGT